MPRVLLHDRADHGALRVEDRETRSDLLGEREQVELDTEPAVVAALGFFESVEVLGERRGCLPRRAVDALQHRAVLVAAPVGAGDAHQLERAEPGGARDVGTTAEVDELGSVVSGVAVHGDDRAAPDLGAVDPFDDLLLERLVGEAGEALVTVELLPDERLVRGDDRSHALLDALEVVVGEALLIRELEVVVEAVLDRRSDRVARPGEQVGHRLGEHVRGRVAQHLAAFGCRGVMMATGASWSTGRSRSTGSPSTAAARAALARRGPIDVATSRG